MNFNNIAKSKIFSKKNGRDFFYRNDDELQLILKFENDSNVETFEQFMAPIFDNENYKLIEEAAGFIVNYNETVSYLLISEFYADNPKMGEKAKELLLKGQKPGKVRIIRRSAIAKYVGLTNGKREL
jgi:hypothetical protein